MSTRSFESYGYYGYASTYDRDKRMRLIKADEERRLEAAKQPEPFSIAEYFQN